jgi:hypothetical protein
MSRWSNEIELRDENGTMHAYSVRNNREIPIPKYPKQNADMFAWLTNLSLDELEAARQYYLDRWTWDEDSERYAALVALVASELYSRLCSMERTILDLGGRVAR